jgi:hypothetical protein
MGRSRGQELAMYEQRMRVRLLEQTYEDESALVYEGEWLAIPDIEHEVLIIARSGGRTLWKVEGVRHVVGVDGRCLHSDILVSRAE